MGRESEDYAMVPPALNLSKGALDKALRGRVESSIGLAKARKQREKEADGSGDKKKEDAKKATATGANRLSAKPTKPLLTFQQRRKYVVKSMDMHRHTSGGGRSGRRGRAECTAFFRYVLEVLDAQHQDALDAQEDSKEETEEKGTDVCGKKNSKGGSKSAGGEEKEEEEEVSSSEEENSSSEEEEVSSLEEEEEEVEPYKEEGEEKEEKEFQEAPKTKPKPNPKPAATPVSPPKRKVGRPRKNPLPAADTTAATSVSAASVLETSSTITKQSTKQHHPSISKSESDPPQSAPRIVMNDKDFFDQHNDLCEVCNQPGELLCCATCNLVFHVHCARPKLHSDPPDDWKCAYCWAAGVMGGRRDGKERQSAQQACREMERTRARLREERVAQEQAVEEEKRRKEEPADQKLSTVPETVYATRAEAVAAAAKSGCRKCIREMETGKQTRKMHDDFCPRKWKSVGRPPPVLSSASPVADSSAAVGDSAGAAGLKREEVESKEEKINKEEVGMEEIPVVATSPPDLSPRCTPVPTGIVSLAEAAAAGCLKCQKELDTGEKTRKVHADNCPRKYRGANTVTSGALLPEPPVAVGSVRASTGEDGHLVGKPPSMKNMAVKHRTSMIQAKQEPQATEKMEPKLLKEKAEVSEEFKSTNRELKTAKQRQTKPMAGEQDKRTGSVDVDGGAPVEAHLLRKKSMNARIPRKKTSQTPREEFTEDFSDLAIPPVLEGAGANNPTLLVAPTPRKKIGRPSKLSKSLSRSSNPAPKPLGRPPKSPTSLGRPSKVTSKSPAKWQSSRDLVTLEEAAATGCLKCRRELETGEKTRKEHSEKCPRKWRAAGRPPGAGKRGKSTGRGCLKEGEKVGEDGLERDSAELALAAKKAKFLITTKSPEVVVDGKARKGRKFVSSTTEDKDDEVAAAALEDLVAAKGDATKKEDERLLLSGDEEEEEDDVMEVPLSLKGGGGVSLLNDRTSLSNRKEEKEEQVVVKNEECAKETKPLKCSVMHKEGRPTFKMGTEDGARVEEVLSTAMVMAVKSENGANPSDCSGNEPVLTLRGGGRTKKLPVKMEESSEVTTTEVASAASTSGVTTQALATSPPPSASLSVNSGSSTPTSKRERELQRLSVPTPLKLGEEHELTYSNYGRVQRSRRRPMSFQPHTGTDREVDCSQSKRQKVDNEEKRFKISGLDQLRGRSQPKKEEATAAKPLPVPPLKRGRGRPPSKHTKNVEDNKKNKKTVKQAPIKKETNSQVSGVVNLNRRPGSLFDCSACLDIGKIKLCCYCACRLCFNKFGKEQTILCDKCDQEYHTFCLGLDGIPDEEWECPACIEDEKKKKMAEQRKKKEEEKKRTEEEKKKEEESKKAAAIAKRRAAYQERKKAEEERKRIQSEKRKIAYEKRRRKEAEMRAAGIPVKDKTPMPTTIVTRKRGPGRPPKSETLAKMQAELILQQQMEAAKASEPPVKRGRGRPRKDGSAPIPRKLPSKFEISAANLYVEPRDYSPVERSRSGRKIQRTVFHDEVEGGGLMTNSYKRPRGPDDRDDISLFSPSHTALASRQASMYVSERSAATTAKSVAGLKKETRRKPGARNCMQITRKFTAGVIEQDHFNVLMDYSKRAKVDHLIRMRERMDEHSRFLESQLAGLEALVKEKGEWDGRVPAAKPSAYSDVSMP